MIDSVCWELGPTGIHTELRKQFKSCGCPPVGTIYTPLPVRVYLGKEHLAKSRRDESPVVQNMS